MSRRCAYATLLTKPGYLPGLMVLHESLLAVGAKYQLVVMVTPAVSQEIRRFLVRRGLTIREITRLQPEGGTHTHPELDARFGDTWTKLRAFELTEYDRLVLLDSDMMVMKNMDELFELDLPEGWIAASHACACNPHKFPHYPQDWTPENCAHTSVAWPTAISSPPVISGNSPRPYKLLNSGLVVLSPTLELAAAIHRFLAASPLVPEFKFPDQDLLAVIFENKWKVLPWCYNALKTMRVVHKQIWRDDEVRCLHYILSEKPWATPPGDAGEYEEVNSWWWDRYRELESRMRWADSEGWSLIDAQVVSHTDLPANGERAGLDV